MTQQQLADKLHVNRSMVAQIETGRREPSVKLMRGFMRVLGACPMCGSLVENWLKESPRRKKASNGAEK